MDSFKKTFYQPRDYRKSMDSDDLKYFTVVQCETDLRIAVDKVFFSSDVLKYAESMVTLLRGIITGFAQRNTGFLHSLEPISIKGDQEDIIKKMFEGAMLAGVGPMATVAGAIAQFVAEKIQRKFVFKNVIIENGGDLYLCTDKKRIVAINAGESPLSNKIGILVDATSSPLGLCTSSGTVGHSLSFGSADAAVVVSRSAVVADAFATALGNRVNSTEDITESLNWLVSHPEVMGGVVIIGDKIGAIGKVELISLT